MASDGFAARAAYWGRNLRGTYVGLRCAFAGATGPGPKGGLLPVLRAARAAMQALPELKRDMAYAHEIPDQCLRMRLNVVRRAHCGMAGDKAPPLAALFNEQATVLQEFAEVYTGQSRDMARQSAERHRGIYSHFVQSLRQESALRQHGRVLGRTAESLDRLARQAESLPEGTQVQLYRHLRRSLKAAGLAQ
jgi:hypothetical protein